MSLSTLSHVAHVGTALQFGRPHEEGMRGGEEERGDNSPVRPSLSFVYMYLEIWTQMRQSLYVR